MEEKIYDEWNKPTYVQVDSEEYQKLIEKLKKYEIATDYIKQELEIDDCLRENIKRIIEELENEIN